MKKYTMKELHEIQRKLVKECNEENKELTKISLKIVQEEINRLIEKGIKYL